MNTTKIIVFLNVILFSSCWNNQEVETEVIDFKMINYSTKRAVSLKQTGNADFLFSIEKSELTSQVLLTEEGRIKLSTNIKGLGLGGSRYEYSTYGMPIKYEYLHQENDTLFVIFQIDFYHEENKVKGDIVVDWWVDEENTLEFSVPDLFYAEYKANVKEIDFNGNIINDTAITCDDYSFYYPVADLRNSLEVYVVGNGFYKTFKDQYYQTFFLDNLKQFQY